jgi:hypothetical protein
MRRGERSGRLVVLCRLARAGLSRHRLQAVGLTTERLEPKRD